MKSGSSGSSGSSGPSGSTGAPGGDRLSLVFLGIAALELAVIVSLYWVGRHFGS